MNKIFLGFIVWLVILITTTDAAEISSGSQEQFEVICSKCNLDCLNRYEKDKLYKIGESSDYLALFFDHVSRGSSNREFFVYIFDGSSCKQVLKSDAASAWFEEKATFPDIASYWHSSAQEGKKNTYFWNGKEYEDINHKATVAKRNKLNNEALQLFKHGDLGQAITKWKEIEKKLVPYDAEVFNNIGFAFYEMAKVSKNTSDYSNADDYFGKALQVEPARWTALLNAGDLEYDVGYIVSALRHYEMLLKVKPDYKYADKLRARIQELKLEPKEVGVEVTVYKWSFGKKHTTYTRVDKNNVLRREYYSERGNLSRLQNLTNGIENGEFRSWNASGDLQAIGQMEMGKRIGKWVEYYPNGNIKQVLMYNADGTSTDVTKEFVNN